MQAVDNIAPNIDKYYKDTMAQVRSQGYLISYFGRKRRFGLLTPDSVAHIERQAVNFKPQSSGSDLMLYNMLHLWDIKDRWEIWPFWPVHDSITIDMPDQRILPEIRKEMERFSEELVGGIMNFIWEDDWGYNWAMDKEPLKGTVVTL